MNLMEASRHRVAGELRTEVENKRDRVRRDGEEARARRRRDREDEKLDIVVVVDVVVVLPPRVSNFSEHSPWRTKRGTRGNGGRRGRWWRRSMPFRLFLRSCLLIERSKDRDRRGLALRGLGFSQLSKGWVTVTCSEGKEEVPFVRRSLEFLFLLFLPSVLSSMWWEIIFGMLCCWKMFYESR